MTTSFKPTISSSVQPVDNTSSTQTVDVPKQSSDTPITVTQDIGKLEDLIFLGRITKKCTISNYVFEMATLTAGENEAAFIAAGISDTNDIRAISSITYHVLSYAVKSINGIPFDRIVADKPGDSIYEQKVNFLKGLQQVLLNKLMNSYRELQEESDNIVNKDQVKN